MERLIVVGLTELKDELLGQQDMSAIEAVTAKIGASLLTESALLVSATTSECIHLALLLNKKINAVIHLSHNLSLSMDENKLCNEEYLHQYYLSFEDFIDVEFKFDKNTGNRNPVCEKPVEFVKAMSDSFNVLVIVVDYNVFNILGLAANFRQGRFYYYSNIEEIAIEPEAPVQEQYLENVQVPVTGEIENAWFKDIPINVNVRAMTKSIDQNSQHLFKWLATPPDVSRTLKNQLSNIKTLAKSTAEALEGAGRGNESKMLGVGEQCAVVARELSSLKDKMLMMKELSDSRLGEELENPGTCIEIQSCFYSNKKEGWVLIVLNNSKYTIRDVSVYMIEEDMELANFIMIEAETSVKKIIEIKDILWNKHIIAKWKNVPVSISYPINQIEFKEIIQDDGSFTCVIKNRSSVKFDQLALATSKQPDSIREIIKPLDKFKRRELVVRKDLEDFDGHSLFFTSNGDIVSNDQLVNIPPEE